jgi:adenine-specific DNA-methyltransferase
MSLFQSPEENPPFREAIEFYKHPHNWSNRLIAGDSLLVMNSLLQKEGMAGQDAAATGFVCVWFSSFCPLRC